MYQNCCKKCCSTDLFTKEKVNTYEHVKENLEKKYKYLVYLLADDYSCGYVELTKREAEIVAYATSTINWKDADLNPYSGYFCIGLDNPIEIGD